MKKAFKDEHVDTEKFVRKYIELQKQLVGQTQFINRLLSDHSSAIKYQTNFMESLNTGVLDQLEEIKDKLADVINILAKAKTAGEKKINGSRIYKESTTSARMQRLAVKLVFADLKSRKI